MNKNNTVTKYVETMTLGILYPLYLISMTIFPAVLLPLRRLNAFLTFSTVKSETLSHFGFKPFSQSPDKNSRAAKV